MSDTPPPIPSAPSPSGNPPPPPQPEPSSFTESGASPGVFVEIDRPCFSCSYNLKGLPVTGACPECGQAVQLSLRGILLQYAGPDYLRTIQSGVSLILNGILLLIIVTVASLILAVAIGGRGGPGSAGEIIINLAQLLPTAIIILGYWKFTQPDPSFAGIEKPDSARSVIRITTYVQAAVAVASLLVQLGAFAVAGAASVMVILGGLLAIASLVAGAVQFFATMRYTRWLANRIPDTFIINRTKTYMWLLPVLYTVGAIACGIGPLVALVLYWNLLDRVRKHLRSIIASGAPAMLPGTGF